MAYLNLRTALTSRGAPILTGTDDPDEAAERMASSGLRPVRVVPVSRNAALDAHLSVVPPAHSVGFVRMSFGSEVALSPSEQDEENYVFAMNVAGTAKFRSSDTDVLITPGEVGFVPPEQEFRTLCAAGTDQVLLPMRRRRVERIAAALLDRPAPAPLSIDHIRDIVRPDAEAIEVFVTSLVLNSSSSDAITTRMRRHVEDAAIEAALMTMPSFRESIPRNGRAPSRAVQRAMDFMMANLADPLSLTQIAAHAHVSPRALQTAFSEQAGVTPMRWLRARRLDRARRLLIGVGGPSMRVTDAALAVGFVHLGYFARRYAERFGETPSTTRIAALKGERTTLD